MNYAGDRNDSTMVFIPQTAARIHEGGGIDNPSGSAIDIVAGKVGFYAVLDYLKLTLTGNSFKLAAGVQRFLLTGGGITIHEIAVWLPAAAPALPNALLYDSGLMIFNSGLVGDGSTTNSGFPLRLIPDFSMTGRMSLSYGYHYESRARK